MVSIESPIITAVKQSLLSTKSLFQEPKFPIQIGPCERDEIVKHFVDFHNEANTYSHERGEHRITTNYFYSDSFLPCLVAIHEWASFRQDETTLTLANTALTDLKNAFTYFNFLNETSSFIITLADLIISDSSGNDDQYHALKVLFREARTSAVACIAPYAQQDILLNSNVPVPRKEFQGNFKAVADDALHEYLESQEGVKFPEIFSQELEKAEIVCITLDWNSIFNEKESYANSLVRFLVDQRIKKIRHVFKQKFPNKQILFVISSGRPALYTWAASENVVPIDEIRKFGLAENGGIKFDPNSGETELITPFTNQFLDINIWETKLKELQDFISHQFGNKKPGFEPKQTMLSLRIAEKEKDGGQLLYKGYDDTQIANMVTSFISLETTNTEITLETLIRDIKATPGLLEDIIKLNEMQKGKNDTNRNYWKERVNQRLKMPELPEDKHIRSDKILKNPNSLKLFNQLHELIKTEAIIQEMRDNLILTFNKTAGFVDIHHLSQNKFSGLFNVLPANKLALVLHIGDSISDVPDIKNSPFEQRQKIEEVFLFGPDNASADFRRATTDKKERGYIAARSSVLGLFDILLGLLKEIH